MDYADYIEILKSRRTVRSFSEEPVSISDIEKCLEAARFAMSGSNAQPWDFVIVTKDDKRKKLIESKNRIHSELCSIEETRKPEYYYPPLKNDVSYIPFRNAPAFVVVLADRRAYQACHLAVHYGLVESSPDSMFHKGIGNATANIIMAAHILGIDSTWLSVDKLWEEEIKNLLKIPRIYEIPTVVALGHRDYDPPQAYRRELSEMVHYEEYDMDKYRTGEDIKRFVCELRIRSDVAYNSDILKKNV